MLKPHMCACIHTHKIQEKNQLPKLECRVIALVKVQAFHRCLIVHMGQASFEMNRQYIKCTLSLPRSFCLSDFVEGF